jgi:hypothetical protein
MNLYDIYKNDSLILLKDIKKDKELVRHIQINLSRLGLLDKYGVDGILGSITEKTLKDFQSLVLNENILKKEFNYIGKNTAKKLIELKYLPKKEKKEFSYNSFAEKIIVYMYSLGYDITEKEGEYNIVYIEGMNEDFSLNDNKPNYFNDLRLLISFINDEPKIVEKWQATTEPGTYYTLNPMLPGGAARICFGQYKAWRIGWHTVGTPHEALIQVMPISITRDANKDYSRYKDAINTGYFGINQHHGYDYPENNIAYASAGCLVGRTIKGHKEFINLLKKDKRYLLNKNYIFNTVILEGSKI